MAIQSFNINMNARLDTTAAEAQVQAFYNQVQTQPLRIETQFQDVDVGNAQSILDSIKTKARSVESVTVDKKTASKAGASDITGLTQMTVVWRDELGNVFKTVKAITSGLSTMSAGYRVTSTESAKFNLGSQGRDIKKFYDQRLKEFDSMTAKATEWSIRAETMGEKEKKAVQDTAKALKEEIELYKAEYAANNLTNLSAREANIKKLNQAHNDSIAVTKRAATGMRSWGESIANALKQTISYTFSLGGLKGAQQMLTDGMQYVIDLNKEMVNVQVLQAEGAKTPSEIKDLANSYNQLAIAMGTTTLEIARGSVEWLFY